MSPYPSQTDHTSIVETARLLIEQDGVDAISLGRIASELGVKAPSLYRYIKNKNALLRAVIEQTYKNLFTAYETALASSDDLPMTLLLNLSRAQRDFALQNPNAYMLAYTVQEPEQRADPNMLLKHAQSVQKIVAEIAGEKNSLPALRGLLAITHGFIMLELNGQLRRGGDLSATFNQTVLAYLKGWQSS